MSDFVCANWLTQLLKYRKVAKTKQKYIFFLSAPDEVFDDGDRKWLIIDDLDLVDDTQEGLANLLVCAN